MADEFVTPNPPAPWTRVLDESTGCYYYFNTRSGESVWETPAVVTAVLEGFEPNTAVEPAGDDSGAAAASGAGTDEYSDVIDTVVADLTVDAPRPGEEDLPTSFHGHRSSVAILLTPDGTATPAKRKPAPSNSTSNDSSAAAVGKGGGDAAASSEELPGPPDADSATPRARTLTVNTTPAPAPVQKKSFISRLMQKLRITKPDSPGVAAGGAGGNAAVTFGNVVASDGTPLHSPNHKALHRAPSILKVTALREDKGSDSPASASSRGMGDRRISFADTVGRTLEQVNYVDNLHYSNWKPKRRFFFF